MRSRDEARYRLGLARNFLEEAKRAFDHREWRLCVRSSRDGVENAAKAVIALFEPVQKSHNPDKQLGRLVEQGTVKDSQNKDAEELVRLSAGMGVKKHVLIQYGDEETFTDPWQLFDEKAAREALTDLKAAVQIATTIWEGHSTEPSNM